jgi:hypothetical protein|tara:strand:- start:1370 stop:1624 length:255 start_codon:yes stop_codon:yes gene_type:complete
MTKHMMIKALSEYLQAKNVDKISLPEYKADPKAPIRDFLLRRKFGSWNRVLAAARHRFPVEMTPVVEAPVVAPAPKKAKAKKED